jgi:hypothetical protein
VKNLEPTKTLFPLLHDSFVCDLALVLSCCALFVLITRCGLKFYLLFRAPLLILADQATPLIPSHIKAHIPKSWDDKQNAHTTLDLLFTHILSSPKIHRAPYLQIDLPQPFSLSKEPFL